jgi:hypothetical protein
MEQQRNTRINIMNDTIIELDEHDKDLFTSGISDDALEVAAGDAPTANYTLGSCTGMISCPA